MTKFQLAKVQTINVLMHHVAAAPGGYEALMGAMTERKEAMAREKFINKEIKETMRDIRSTQGLIDENPEEVLIARIDHLEGRLITLLTV